MSTLEWRKKNRRYCVDKIRQWRKDNPEKYKARMRADRERIKQKRLEDPEFAEVYKQRIRKRSKSQKSNRRLLFKEFKKTLTCARCPENTSYCLDFHHLDPFQKDVGVSRLRSATLDRIKKETAKCVVLCSNCHRKEHERLRIAEALKES